MESKSTAGRIAEIQRSGTPARLLKGAENMGTAWRAGQRCLSEFSRICPCTNPTDFCQVKLKWIQIAEEYYGGQPFGLAGHESYYVIEAMTISQFRATGLTAVIEIPTDSFSGEKIYVGPKGTHWGTIANLTQLQDDDAALAVAIDAIVKLQKVDRR